MVLLNLAEIQAWVEAERSSIAAEIHDGLLPYLFAAAGKLAALRQSEAAAESPLADALAEAARWVDESRQVARQLMAGISYPPAALSDPVRAAAAFLDDVLDLSSRPEAPRIVWPWDLASDVRGQQAPDFAEAAPPLAELPAEAAVAIYRLVIESVRNAVRHASAEKIEVTVQPGESGWSVRIQDDGCGFDLNAAVAEGLHGLTLARRRARAGGIKLEIDSSQTPGSERTAGTCITLTVMSE